MACCQEEYHIAGDDPTLSACCAKDKQEKEHYARVMGILSKEDITKKRLDQRYVAVEEHLPSKTNSVALTSMDESDQDDEFDYLMDDESIVSSLEQERRAALAKKMELRQQGLGIVWGDKEFEQYTHNIRKNDAKVLLDAKHNRPVVIVKKHSNDHVHEQMTLPLVLCAEKYLGTCFFIVSDNEALSRIARRSISGCVILALNSHGDYIAHKAIDTFNEDTWDGTLMPWLLQCNVLRETYIHATIKRDTKKDDDEEEAPTGYDCGHDGCRLKYGYYHEHVGASKETKQEISQWRQ